MSKSIKQETVSCQENENNLERMIDDEQNGLDEACPICLDTMSLHDDFALPCSHNFHSKCIYKWLRSQDVSNCPVCRFPVQASVVRMWERFVRMKERFIKMNARYIGMRERISERPLGSSIGTTAMDAYFVDQWRAIVEMEISLSNL